MEQSIFSMISEDIINNIVSNTYKPGDLIPSESALCAHYGVTRTTVRRALALLVKKNIVSSIPGKGYVINYPSQNKFSVTFDERNCISPECDTNLMEVKIIEPSLELMLKLQISQKKKVVNIKRLFTLDGKHIGLDDKYITYYTGIPIVEREIHYMTFPNIFANKTSIRELSAEICLKAQQADAYIANLFSIPYGAAVTLVEQTIKDSHGSVLGWGQAFYKADEFELNGMSL